jgi:prepilin-type N-terminal cleavage/methylation domain-containing protein
MTFLPAPRKSGFSSREGFTLIELLVVIAIIAILMGLLFPAAQSALNSAKKTTAKNQAVQIATAISSYEAEYGRLPAFTGSNMITTNLNMLIANDTNNNPRAINFLDTSAWTSGKGGTNANGFLDPWSNAYSISLDTNYVYSQSNVVLGGGFSATNVTKHIMVWTTPTVGSTNVLIDSWD